MKAASLILSLILAFAGAISDQLAGKWSGNWTPKEGTPDAITVELKEDRPGKLAGQFLTPVRMPFTNATFDPKTRTVLLEAVDEKSGKHYRVDGKVQGNDLKGTLAAGEVKGDLLLIKWTFMPH